MSSAILILTYLQLSYLLTQIINTRTKSPQKGLFLFHAQSMEHGQWLCPDDGSEINDKEVQKILT